jgi:3-hydroxyisobutyrate dehydrogenase-like beta-hydroxyacid dehydrogenase
MADGKKSVGYLGMGIMGSAMAGRLADAGFPLTVWNRSKDKCDPLASKGAKVADTPKQVVESCDIVFACTSDPASARAVVFGEGGVLAGMGPGKKFVDMSTVDEECSKEIAAAITAKGGIFLEAPVSGSKGPALNGQLVILAAGSKELKEEAQPMFDMMGKRTFFLGEVGCGARMKLVINMVMGINMVALCEGLAVGTKSGLDGADILEVIKEGAIACPMYGLKGPTMMAGKYDPAFPLKHEQKDMRLAVGLGDQVAQPLPLAAAANEAFKAAMASGRGDDDFSAVFEAIKRPRLG